VDMSEYFKQNRLPIAPVVEFKYISAITLSKNKST